VIIFSLIFLTPFREVVALVHGHGDGDGERRRAGLGVDFRGVGSFEYR